MRTVAPVPPGPRHPLQTTRRGAGALADCADAESGAPTPRGSTQSSTQSCAQSVSYSLSRSPRKARIAQNGICELRFDGTSVRTAAGARCQGLPWTRGEGRCPRRSPVVERGTRPAGLLWWGQPVMQTQSTNAMMRCDRAALPGFPSRRLAVGPTASGRPELRRATRVLKPLFRAAAVFALVFAGRLSADDADQLQAPGGSSSRSTRTTGWPTTFSR